MQKRHETKVDEYHPPRAEGGHGGGDPRIIDDFIGRACRGERSCIGAVDARNSAAIAIASAISCETGQRMDHRSTADSVSHSRTFLLSHSRNADGLDDGVISA